MRHAIFISCYAQLIQRHALMARTLRERGWKVSAIVWDRARTRGAVAAPAEGLDRAIAIELHAPYGTIGLVTRMPTLYRAVRRAVAALGEADLIVLTHFCLLPLAWILPRGAGPRVYDAAEFYCLDFAEYFGGASRLALPAIQALERLLLRRIDATVVPDSRGGWFARYYEAMGQPVHVTFNVPSLGDDPPPGGHDEAAALFPGRRVVAYVGGLKYAKGVPTALRAAAEVRAAVPDVLFLFVGAWQRGRAEIERLIADLHLHDCVRFQDHLPYRAMLARIRPARVGVALLQGRRNEFAGAGGSRKIFSYMQAGLPIVASRTGEVCALVEQIGCGTLVDVGSVPEIAAVLIRYLNDADLAARHGARGRAAFVGRYNWQRESRAFVEFIERVGDAAPDATAQRT